MTRIKKSRKVGSATAPKKPRIAEADKVERVDTRAKKPKGHKPGSRHSAAEIVNNPTQQANKDSRLGSKKPISLVVEKVVEPEFRRDLKPQIKVKKTKPVDVQAPVTKVKSLTPSQEISQIESDERLNSILDKLDDKLALIDSEQQYFDKMTARHSELLDIVEKSKKPSKKAKSSDPDDLLSRLDDESFLEE